MKRGLKESENVWERSMAIVFCNGAALRHRKAEEPIAFTVLPGPGLKKPPRAFGPMSFGRRANVATELRDGSRVIGRITD